MLESRTGSDMSLIYSLIKTMLVYRLVKTMPVRRLVKTILVLGRGSVDKKPNQQNAIRLKNVLADKYDIN
jgi:hypothetical protein